MVEPTLFDLPNTPEEFGVILPPAELRRLDFSGLDYPTARRAILEYIRTYYPDDFNDFAASNGIIMVTEIVSAVCAKLSLRADLLASSAFLPTANSEEAIVNHLALINQKVKGQTPAVVDVEVTVDQPLVTDVRIPAGTRFQVTGTKSDPIFYEVYRAPGDFDSDIVIPAGKRGTIAYGLEGQFATPVSIISSGGVNQEVVISAAGILDQPIFVTTQTQDGVVEKWDVFPEPIQRFAANDRVVEVLIVADKAVFRFGDDITGASPKAGQVITITYRQGGGKRGRIGVSQISSTRPFAPDPPANASVAVSFRNITPSVGGTDKETIAQAKKRAPRDFAVGRSIVTGDDYAQVATSFQHPVYGAVSKSIATIRTGLNANLVEVYILTQGPNDVPVLPNAGLKLGLQTYYDNLNVLTDHTTILDGALKPVNVEMDIIMHRNSDATVVQQHAEEAITDFFNADNWEMGEPFYLSNLIEVVEAIDGVAYVNVFSPQNNILSTGAIADPESTGVGFNELIIEGTRKVNYYYDRSAK